MSKKKLVGGLAKLSRPRLVIVLVLVCLVAISVIGLDYFNNKKDDNNTKTDEISLDIDNDQGVTSEQYEYLYSRKFQEAYDKGEDLDSAFYDCTTIASEYASASDYDKAISAIDSCIDYAGKASDIPWFIYLNKGYIYLTKDDKVNAKKNLQKAVDDYKEDKYFGPVSLESAKKELEKL